MKRLIPAIVAFVSILTINEPAVAKRKTSKQGCKEHLDRRSDQIGSGYCRLQRFDGACNHRGGYKS